MDDKQKDEYIIQLESIIALMPGNVYWLDLVGRYLGCNMNVAKILKLPTPSSIIGKTNFDLFDKKAAISLTLINEDILSGNEKTIEEIGIDKNGKKCIYLSRKLPLYNDYGKIKGLYGISINMSEYRNIQSAEQILQKYALYAINPKQANIPNLTRRQNDCLYYLLRGMSAKQTAKILKLSPRTVEMYIEQLKNKFNCDSRSALIEKSIDLGFLNF